MKDSRIAVEINDFSGGLVTSIPIVGMETRFSPDCLNVYSNGPALVKRSGISKLNTATVASTSACNGLYNWVQTANSQYLVSVFGSKLYKMPSSGSAWNGTFSVVAADASSGTNLSDSITHFATYQGVLLMTNEDRVHPQRILTTDTSHKNIEFGGAGTAPNAKYIQVWKDHIWLLNIGAGGALEDDGSSLASWTTTGGGAATVTTTTVLGVSSFLFTGTTGTTAAATRVISGGLSDNYEVEMRTYFTALGITAGGHATMSIWNGVVKFDTRWSDDGLQIYDGTNWNTVGVSLVQESVWATWRFYVTAGTTTGARVDIYKDDIPVGLQFVCANAVTASDGSVQMQAISGTGTAGVWHLDYVNINNANAKTEYYTDDKFESWVSASEASYTDVALPTQPLVHYRLNDNTTNTTITNVGANSDAGTLTALNTILLLHCDGTDGSTTITDSSPYARSLSCVGDAQLDTAQKKFGTASLLFDGTGDYVSIPDSADFAYGTNDFTIDFWVRFNSTANSGTFYSQTPNSFNEFLFYWTTSNRLYFYCTESSSTLVEFYANWTPSSGTWYHLAVVRNGNSWYIFIDGVSQTLTLASGSYSLTIPNYAWEVDLGAYHSASSDTLFFNGWLDEFRISRSARWTANFTPPSSAYTLDTDSYTATGKISSGITLNRDAIYLASATVSSINDDTAGSVLFWINPTTLSGTIFSLGDTDGDNYLNVEFVDSSKIQLTVNGTSGGEVLSCRNTTTISTGTFTHVGLVTNGTAGPIFYINNSVDATVYTTSTDKSAWFSASGASLDNGRLGCKSYSSSSNTSYTNCVLDDFRYYSTSISTTHVSSIYGDGNGNEGVATTAREGTTVKQGTYSYKVTLASGSYALVSQTVTSGSALAGNNAIFGMFANVTNSINYKLRITAGSNTFDSAVLTGNGTWQYQYIEATPTAGEATVRAQMIMLGIGTGIFDVAGLITSDSAVSNDNSDRIQRSALTLYNDWSGTDSGYNDIYTPGDRGLTGSCVLNDRMYVFKAYSIHAFTYTGSTPLVDIKQIRNGIGTKSPRSIQNVVIPGEGEVVIFLGTDKRLYKFDGFDTALLSDAIEISNGLSDFYFQNINSSALDKVHAVLHDNNSWYEIFIPLGTDAVCNYSIIYNYRTKSFWPNSNRSFKSSLLSNNGAGQRVAYVGAASNGFVYQTESTSSDDGTSINSYWVTPKMGDQTMLMTMDEVNLLTESVSATPTLSWREDFNPAYTSKTLSASTNAHNYNMHLKDNFIQFKIADNSTSSPFKVWWLRVLNKALGHGK